MAIPIRKRLEIALAALHRAPKSERIERARTAAAGIFTLCRTAEGSAWLRMGLAAHGERMQSPFHPTPRTMLDEALTALASRRA